MILPSASMIEASLMTSVTLAQERNMAFIFSTLSSRQMSS